MVTLIVRFCEVFYVLLCINLCHFTFCNHLDEEKRAGCFAFFIFVLSCDCCVALPHDATGFAAVCDCGIS